MATTTTQGYVAFRQRVGHVSLNLGQRGRIDQRPLLSTRDEAGRRFDEPAAAASLLVNAS